MPTQTTGELINSSMIAIYIYKRLIL